MKKISILLFSLFVGLFTFCNANDFIKQYSYESATSFLCTENCECRTNYSNSPGQGDFEVFIVDNKGLSIKGIRYNCDTPGNATYSFEGSNNFNFNIPVNHGYCRFTVIFDGQISSMSDCPDVIITSSSSCPVCETCPEVNTGDILSGSCDTNYCVENDLCPVPSNFSQLFINDLEFPGKPLINVNIPDYIYWDYFSNDTGFDLYVGSGYDQNYIDSVLKINSYRPDSSDFTNIFVSGLTLLFPYLIFALFLVFMRKLIKRIFKH